MNLRYTVSMPDGRIETYRTRVRRLADGWWVLYINDHDEIAAKYSKGPFPTEDEAERMQLSMLRKSLSGPGTQTRALTPEGKRLLKKTMPKRRW